MKKIFSTIILFLLFVTNIYAQTETGDSVAIKNFIGELHNLAGDYVNAVRNDSKTMLDDIKRQAQVRFGDKLDNTMFSGLGKIWEDGYYQLSFTADNASGRNMLLDVIERHNVVYSDELFGIPLVSASRDEYEEQYLFADYNNTFIFHIDDDEVSIVYANYPLLDLLKNIMIMLMVSVDDSVIDVESLVYGILELSLSVDDLSWKQVVGGSGRPTAGSNALMKPVTNYETVLYSGENGDVVLSELSLQTMDSEMQRLREAISKLSFPAFLENKTVGKHLVAIPQVPAEWIDECEPYALNNIYDWINETGFGNGVNSAHRQSAIITPRDVLLQYAAKYLVGKDTAFIGYPVELKKIYTAEYQGGTPAVLYSKSLTPEGYCDMMTHLGRIYKTKVGDKYKNLKVTQRVTRNGYNYIQLYGDAGVLVYIIESPTERCCQMFITIGADAFTHAVNACSVGGETGVAGKCAIIINEEGIFFPQDNGCGVKIEFNSLNKIKKHLEAV